MFCNIHWTFEHKNRAELQNKYVAVIETLLELLPFLISKGIYKNKIQNPKNLSKKEAYLGQ